MSVKVTPVASRRELAEFVELPFRLHSSQPRWVPPLRLERRLFLSRQRNAFFAHGEAEYFLARRGGRVVGRVSAHIDHAFNIHHDNAWGMFGFLELEDDPETMAALMEAAAAWLRERDRDRMVGPMDFTMNDESGVLVEGFDLDPDAQAALAPAPLSAPVRGGGSGQGDGPADVEPGGLRPQQGPAGDLRAGRAGAARSTGSRCAR